MSTQNTEQTDDNRAEDDRRETERRTVRALETRGPLDVVDLATALETHPMTVEIACERLRERDCVRLVGSSRYRLVENENDTSNE